MRKINHDSTPCRRLVNSDLHRTSVGATLLEPDFLFKKGVVMDFHELFYLPVSNSNQQVDVVFIRTIQQPTDALTGRELPIQEPLQLLNGCIEGDETNLTGTRFESNRHVVWSQPGTHAGKS